MQLDINVLQEQKNHLKVKVEEQKREITNLKTELLMLKKQKETSECSIGIINRYWNNVRRKKKKKNFFLLNKNLKA